MTGVKRDLVERLTDFVHHGIIPRCPNCKARGKKGPFLKKMTGGWACPGNYDPVRKIKIPCDFYETQVKRPALRMPE